MPSPSVTIVVPTYNGDKWIQDALTSLQALTYSGNIEIVVVDDASTDDTIDVVTSLRCDARLVRLESNTGEAFARNVGLARARGDLVTFVDQDDVVSPDHLDVLSALRDEMGVEACAPRSLPFVTNPQTLAGKADDVVLADHANVVATVTAAMMHAPVAAADRVSFEQCADGGISNTVLAPRDLLVSVGGFSGPLRGTGDYMLLCNIARHSTLAKAGRATYGYRLHPGMSTYRYDMARNVLLCRVLLTPLSDRHSLSPAWNVDLLAGYLRSGHAPDGALARFADSIAYARLLRVGPRGWASVARRLMRGEK